MQACYVQPFVSKGVAEVARHPALADSRGFPADQCSFKAAMSKPSPIVAFMRARFEYVSCMFKGHKDKMPAKLKTDAFVLRQLTIIRSVSVADGIVLGKMLDDCPLSLDACDQIREAIQLKFDVGGFGGFAMSHRKQDHSQSP